MDGAPELEAWVIVGSSHEPWEGAAMWLACMFFDKDLATKMCDTLNAEVKELIRKISGLRAPIKLPGNVTYTNADGATSNAVPDDSDNYYFREWSQLDPRWINYDEPEPYILQAQEWVRAFRDKKLIPNEMVSYRVERVTEGL